jgi:hypothetical protein
MFLNQETIFALAFLLNLGATFLLYLQLRLPAGRQGLRADKLSSETEDNAKQKTRNLHHPRTTK